MKKITEVLGKPKEGIKLDVYVDEHEGRIINLADKPGISDLSEKDLNEIVEKAGKTPLVPSFRDTKRSRLDKYRVWITENIPDFMDIITEWFFEKFTKYTFELTDPSYSIISKALILFDSLNGKPDTVSGGKVIFDGCYTGNQGKLSEIMEITDLYIALCLKCSELIEIAHVEYKKK